MSDEDFAPPVLAPRNPRLADYDTRRCPDGHYPATAACAGCRTLIRRRAAARVPVDNALGSDPFQQPSVERWLDGRGDFIRRPADGVHVTIHAPDGVRTGRMVNGVFCDDQQSAERRRG